MKFPRFLLQLGGPALGILVYLLMRHHGHEIAATAGTATWVAFWWITEATNLYLTGLIPLVIFPLTGVLSMKEVAPQYMSQIIFLFIGGFILAFAMEKWNLHRRIALNIIRIVGATPSRILLGFMFSSYFLSMWILNTATVMMLLPAALAVLTEIGKQDEGLTKKLTVPMLLGLAYASSIGGTGSLIGTAPNLVLADYVAEHHPELPEISFGNWLIYGIPTSAVFFVILFLVLRYAVLGKIRETNFSIGYVRDELQKMGKMAKEEKAIGIVFLTTIVLWLFMKDINIGSVSIPGWTSLSIFPEGAYIKESTIAMIAGISLFFLPSKKDDNGTILSWDETKKIPFGLVFLFGGGFALAKGVSASGLSDLISSNLSFVENYSIWVVVLVLCVFMTFFTELTSNTASTLLLLPVIDGIASHFEGISPMTFLLPVTISASFAFMLPVATPPNTIVFASERLTVSSMAKAGIGLNLIGVILTTLFALTLGALVFGY